MKVLRFCLFMALGGSSLVGWGLSEREIRVAMCSYYPDWEFCKEVKKEAEERRMRDLAIEGLSKKVHEIERRMKEREGRKEYLCVKAYRLNVRLYPLDGKVIGVYRKGARVEVIDRIGGWVRTKEGWVSERWLEACDGGSSSGSADGRGLSDRSEPLSGGGSQSVEKPEAVRRVSDRTSEVLR